MVSWSDRENKKKETLPDHCCGTILLHQLAFHLGHNPIDLKAGKERSVISAPNQTTYGWTARMLFKNRPWLEVTENFSPFWAICFSG